MVGVGLLVPAVEIAKRMVDRDDTLSITSEPSSESPQLAGFVVGMFYTTMIDMANEFGTINTIPSNVLPSVVFNKYWHPIYFGNARRYKEASGIVVKTLMELEAFSDVSFQSLNLVCRIATRINRDPTLNTTNSLPSTRIAKISCSRMKNAELVLVPSPGIGHLASMMELAELLVDRDDRVSITVIIIRLALDSKISRYTESLTASSKSTHIQFIDLPSDKTNSSNDHPAKFVTSLIESQKPHVKEVVSKLITQSELNPKPPRLACFVLDMFCTGMIDVANEFGVPSYIYFTSSAAFLGFQFHMQDLHDKQEVDLTELKDVDAEFEIPTLVNPLPVKVFPSVMLSKDTLPVVLYHVRRFREAKGIILNTFEEVESHAVKCLSNGENPAVYPVGPILNLKGDAHDVGSDGSNSYRDIMLWLDDQPPSSVVFLCFGSMGSFNVDQVKEIAWALEHMVELGLAVEIKMDYRREFLIGNEIILGAKEIERGIRGGMEPDGHKLKRLKELSEKSRKAMVEGGSSFSSLNRLIEDMIIAGDDVSNDITLIYLWIYISIYLERTLSLPQNLYFSRKKMKKAEVVLIPVPAMGHVVALVEVAKLLVQRDDRLSTTVIIMHPALDPSTTKYTESLAASTLPDRMRVVNLPNLESKTEDTKDLNWLTSMIESQKPHVEEYVSKMRTQSQLSPDSPQLAGFIFDTFATGMKDVANGFGVPWYAFSTSGAAFMGSMFYLQALHDDEGVNLIEFEDSDALLEIPSLASPLPAKLLPSIVFKQESLTIFLEHARIMREARSILVNTFLEFESYALHSLSNGKNPPVYPVGPIVKHVGDARDLPSDGSKDIMEWLDDQPPSSVMFLCFGSWGSFCGKQVKEIACALEHCGHRFLWSLRKPSSQKGKAESPTVEIKMDYRRDFLGDNEIIVSSEDIVKAIKHVMEEDGEVRKKVKEMSRISEKSLKDGGSSFSSHPTCNQPHPPC
ncbi:hypothetical protein NC652_015611 [Populus alba x Populus x berolinensis]|nr:hypothetical protein NC652_015611 [Populus alba x Populus x berolinensis]